ncbi:UBX domain-containing protein 3-like [Panonychus citri]|uniref:UBX domain-containing protein 3-like n=1 Tax=Panonychus citri TaxID=50023 RepID=UPI0023077B45|nr:UBX domain-containing protein 3-like [Panonychus citri]
MFISSVLIAVILSSSVSGQPAIVPRSQTYQGRDTDGTYSFGYTVHEPSGSTKFRQESGDGAGNRQGSYGLEEKDSQRIVFNYATKPKSSTQFISHPVPLTTQQHDHQGPPLSPPPPPPPHHHQPTPLITPSQSTVSASPSGPRGGHGGGPIDGSSVDVGFSPSFEPRGHEMDDDTRFNNPAFDDDFDFDGRGKSYAGGEPKMRQNSNTHWDGGESMGMGVGAATGPGNGAGGANGGAASDPGPWNKQMHASEHNGHHHPHHPHPHQPNGETDHHHHNHNNHNNHRNHNQHHHSPSHHQGGEDTFGINESSEMNNEPASYDQLVAYLAANQQRSAGPPHSRSPMRPEDFAYKSR